MLTFALYMCTQSYMCMHPHRDTGVHMHTCAHRKIPQKFRIPVEQLSTGHLGGQNCRGLPEPLTLLPRL